MIQTFGDKEVERIFHRERSKRFGPIKRIAYRKVRAIHAARLLGDLTIPPVNKLEALHGSRKGQHSIRINNQWRIFFEWSGPDAYEV